MADSCPLRALRRPKTTVSRKVQDLESRLGAQLLQSATRKLGLTEAATALARPICLTLAIALL